MMRSNNTPRPQVRGFTLLEVLIALAIFISAAVVIDSAIQGRLKQHQQNQDRILATWLAENYLLGVSSGIELAEKPKVEKINYGNDTWQVSVQSFATEREGLWRFEVMVFDEQADVKNDGAIAGITRLVVR
ncbi:MAG: type II secretion system minor pseudopilin GspI [Pseudomonadota bacterium]|nr:type II secretion system minor pseudopilin GspI [Pseudomonadota bacterium]